MTKHVESTPAPSQHGSRNRRVLQGLGISELVLGITCVVCGAILRVLISSGPHSRFHLHLGEGIWAGILIVIVGILGIFAGRKESRTSLITAHMALSIVGTIFSFFLLMLNTFSALAEQQPIYLPFHILIELASLTSFVLLILNAAFSCFAMPCCYLEYARAYSNDQIRHVPEGSNAEPPTSSREKPEDLEEKKSFFISEDTGV